MTDLKKRSLLKVAALSAAAAAALVACGKKEEPKPAPAPAPVAAPAPKPEPLKIAFAYVGPVGDGGWTFAHDNGRKAIEKRVRRQGRHQLCGKGARVRRRRTRDP